MKAKNKNASTVQPNSDKKLSDRNKSHPSHEPNLDKLFTQMKTDIINEIKKATEIQIDAHKANFLNLFNKSEMPHSKKTEVKKVPKANKSEKKEKKNKSNKIFSDDDGSIIVLGTEKSLVRSKSKDKARGKSKDKEKDKRKKDVTPKLQRRTKTPSKGDKNVINLIKPSKNNSTETKLPKKNKMRKNNTMNTTNNTSNDTVELIGKKRKRDKGMENLIDLSRSVPNVNINNKKKRSSTKKSQTKPTKNKKNH